MLGSSGMVGNRLADHLAQSGYRVYGFSRRSQLHHKQVWDANQVDCYGKARVDFEADTIVNCAGPSSKWAEENPNQFKLFLTGHANSIEKLAIQTRAKQVVNMSSVHVYSNQLAGLVTENHTHDNTHPYALGHSTLEELLSRRLEVANLRLSNSYGPSGGLTNSTWTLFTHDLIRQFVTAAEGRISGNPYATRDFIPLSEVVNSIEHIIKTKSTGAFNVVSSQTLRLADWARYLAEVGSAILDKRLVVKQEVSGVQVPEFSFVSDKLKSTGYTPCNDSRAELESLFKIAIGVRDAK